MLEINRIYYEDCLEGMKKIDDKSIERKLTPLECERLQTFDEGWTEGISNTQRYKSLGNSWTVDVIAHIFNFLPQHIA